MYCIQFGRFHCTLIWFIGGENRYFLLSFGSTTFLQQGIVTGKTPVEKATMGLKDAEFNNAEEAARWGESTDDTDPLTLAWPRDFSWF